MKVSTIFEMGWIPTGLYTLFCAMPHNTNAGQYFGLVGQLPVVPSVDGGNLNLYIGVIATGISLIGIKIIDLFVYWRNKNKDTVQAKLVECEDAKMEMSQHYNARLKGKDEIVSSMKEQLAAKDQHIDYFKNLIKDLTNNNKPNNTNIVITPTEQAAS